MSFDLASRLASRRAEDLYRQRPLLESDLVKASW